MSDNHGATGHFAGLLEALIFYIRTGQVPENDREDWDGRCLVDFVEKELKQVGKLDQTKHSLKSSFGTFKKARTQGVGKETLLKVLAVASEACAPSLDVFLERFIMDSVKHGKHKSIQAFEKVPQIVQPIVEAFADQEDRFASHRAMLLEDYFGRDATEESLNQHLLESDRASVVRVIGAAGVGKSALMAQMVQAIRKDNKKWCCVDHFVRSGRPESQSRDFLRTLHLSLSPYVSAQLDKEFGALGNHDQYPGFLDRLLTEASLSLRRQGKTLLVVVDGLDETDKKDPSLTGNWNLFFLPNTPPHFVKFLISSRVPDDLPNPTVPDIKLEPDKGFQTLDVRAYIQRKLEQREIQNWYERHNYTAAQFRDKLLDYSGGRFLYPHFVFKNIDRYKDGKLPDGIDEIYRQEYKRFVSSDPRCIDLVSGLVHLTSPLSLELLATFSALSLIQVDHLTKEWVKLRLVEEVKDGPYRFVDFAHKTFPDYLIENIPAHAEDSVKLHCKNQVADELVERLPLANLNSPVDALAIEAFTMILDVLCDVGHSAYRDYLCNQDFCRHYLSMFSDQDRRLVERAKTHYESIVINGEIEDSERFLCSFGDALFAGTTPLMSRDDFRPLYISAGRHPFYEKMNQILRSLQT